MENKTIDKIRKLIAKQQSAEQIGSLEEANTFAAKIQELLTKYNLEIADIGDAKEKPKMGKMEFTDIRNRKSEGKWEPGLYNILAKFNYCMLITHSAGGTVVSASIIGTKENIEIVKFLGDQLQTKIRMLEKIDWNDQGRHTNEKRGKFRRGFYLGAVNGIRIQLQIQRDAQMASQVKVTSLVVQTDKDLADAVDSIFGHLGKRSGGRSSSSVGRSMGHERGRSMQINRGVGSTGNQKSII